MTKCNECEFAMNLGKKSICKLMRKIVNTEELHPRCPLKNNKKELAEQQRKQESRYITQTVKSLTKMRIKADSRTDDVLRDAIDLLLNYRHMIDPDENIK